MERNAGLPLALALAVSAFLHLSLIYGIAIGPQDRRAPLTLQARLLPIPSVRNSAPAVVSAPNVQLDSRPHTTTVAASHLAASEESSIAQADDVSPAAGERFDQAPSRLEETVLPRADVPLLSDPAWYTARDLDVYPRALVPLDLSYPATVDGETAEVALLVKIDESGSVKDMTVVKVEPPGQLEESVLQALKAARFSPAERDGRAVRSQIVIKLRFGPPMQANAGK